LFSDRKFHPNLAAQSRNERTAESMNVIVASSLRSNMLISMVLSGPIGRLGILPRALGLILSGRWSRAIEWRGSMRTRRRSSQQLFLVVYDTHVCGDRFVLARPFLFCFYWGYRRSSA
jgi:hypothetical protein